MTHSTLAASSSDPRRFAVALTLIVLVGLLLRCWQAGESLWLDELHSSWVVADSLAEVAPRAREGNQSPLYFYLLWGLVQLLGHSATTLRLISLVAGTALIAAAGLLVRRWSGSSAAGLLAAWLVAVSTDCIFYAQEARPYALVQLSALGHALLFVTVLEHPWWWRRAAWVASGAWLFYLHYTAALLLVAELVFLLAWWVIGRGKLTYRWRQALVDGLLLALCCRPAAGHLLAIAARRENWSEVFHAWPLVPSLRTLLLLGGAVPVAALAVAAAAHLQRRQPQPTAAVVAWSAVWFAVPIALAWAATFSGLAALFAVRYIVASVVGAVVFAALVQSGFRAPAYRWMMALLLVAGSLYGSGMVPQYLRDGRLHTERREHWDQATRWLGRQLGEQPRPVLLCPGLLEDDLLRDSPVEPRLRAYCLLPLSGLYSIGDVTMEPLPTARDVTLSPSQLRLVGQSGTCWLVVRAGPKTTTAIVQSLTQDMRRKQCRLSVLRRRRFGSVRILLLRCETPLDRLRTRE